jgi:hypothetical protein
VATVEIKPDKGMINPVCEPGFLLYLHTFFTYYFSAEKIKALQKCGAFMFYQQSFY